jgi:N6-adenosine-specific RNA methylase IME4
MLFEMKKYKTIYADPPWAEIGGGQIVRGAQRHYPLMKRDEICALRPFDVPVRDLADENAHLYLWVTNNHLLDGLAVIKAWGFEYKTMITWAKDRFGLGQYFRGQTEHCLFAVRGNLPYRMTSEGKRAQGRTLITAPRKDHSQKPEEMRKMIELVSYPPYLELFARIHPTGWDVWGNQAPDTESESIGVLKSLFEETCGDEDGTIDC